MPPPRILGASHRQGQPGHSSASAPTSASQQQQQRTLPPYEPPCHPLNEHSKRSLADLANTREARRYDEHLLKSSAHLRDAVSTINDTLVNRRQVLEEAVKKRRNAGIDDDNRGEGERLLEQEVAELERDVQTLTERIEAALREVIDARAELEDETAVLAAVVQAVAAQKPKKERVIKRERRRRDHEGGGSDNDGRPQQGEDEPMPDALGVNREEEGDDEEDGPPIAGVKELLRGARKAKADEYAALTAHQRYALNNEYIAFKRVWHDALHQIDNVPLPDASTWFDADGRPNVDAEARMDDDDDLVVEREIIDLKCPLSLQIMTEPFSNKVCKHTFEKSAISDFLNTHRGVIKCPVCTVVCIHCSRFLLVLKVIGNKAC